MLTLFALTSVLVFIGWYLYNKWIHRDIEKLPGPPALPILGNVLDFENNADAALGTLVKLTKRYGRTLRLWLHPKHVNILTTDPRYFEYFLTTKSCIERTDFYKYMIPWLGTGIIVSSGTRWRSQRKLIAPMFNAVNSEKYIPEFSDSADFLVEQLRQKEGGGHIEITDYIYQCTLRSILKTMVHSAITTDTVEAIQKSMCVMLKILEIRTFSLLFRYDWAFQLTDYFKKQMEGSTLVRHITGNFVELKKRERINSITKVGSKRTTLMDLLLRETEANESYTTNNLQDDLTCITLAGFETVATAVSFCIYELSKHPEIQEKILDELDTILGSDSKSFITSDKLQELKYLERVFKESIRKNSPIPLIERKLDHDMVFDGMNIPKGSTITFFIYGMQIDQDVYPEPWKFDPDRFLPENCDKRDSHSWSTFGIGIRNCIGQKFALMEGKMILAKIVRNFKIIAAEPKHEPVLISSGVLKSSNGLPVIFKARNKL